MKKYIILITMSLLTASCTDKDKKNTLSEYLTPAGNTCSNTAKIIVSDTMKVEIPSDVYNNYHTIKKYGDYLYCMPMAAAKTKLTIFDISKGTYCKTIDMDPNLLRSREFTDFCVSTSDSIYLVTYPSNEIVIIDGNGTIKDRWDRNDMQVTMETDSLLSMTGFDINAIQIDRAADLLYASLCPVSRYELENTGNEVNRHGIYDLKKRKWIKFIAPYEGVMKMSNGGTYYFDLITPYQLFVEGKMYVTYMIDHNVYIYDLMSGRLTSEKDISPDDAETFPSPLRNPSYEAANELRRETSFYGQLNYHKTFGMFSRTYTYSLNQRKSSGIRQEICLYDSLFEPICRLPIKNGAVDCLCASEDGFIATKSDVNCPDDVFIYKFSICKK